MPQTERERCRWLLKTFSYIRSWEASPSRLLYDDPGAGVSLCRPAAFKGSFLQPDYVLFLLHSSLLNKRLHHRPPPFKYITPAAARRMTCHVPSSPVGPPSVITAHAARHLALTQIENMAGALFRSHYHILLSINTSCVKVEQMASIKHCYKYYKSRDLPSANYCYKIVKENYNIKHQFS